MIFVSLFGHLENSSISLMIGSVGPGRWRHGRDSEFLNIPGIFLNMFLEFSHKKYTILNFQHPNTVVEQCLTTRSASTLTPIIT